VLSLPIASGGRIVFKRALIIGALLLLGAATALTAQATPRSGGARSAAAPTAASLLGKWEITVNAPDQVRTLLITFQRIDGALLGSGEADFGSFTVSDVTQTGSDLGFVMKFAADGMTLDIPFKGKLTGAAAEGTLTFAMGGDGPQTYPWTGKKVP
jgi:hypothetical protein